MEKPQPSPAPWYVEADSLEQLNVYDAEGEWVAMLPHQCLRSLEEIQRVNAPIVAAAPELLAALEALVPPGFSHRDAMCHYGLMPLDQCAQCQRIIAAQAAIAKARGKTPHLTEGDATP